MGNVIKPCFNSVPLNIFRGPGDILSHRALETSLTALETLDIHTTAKKKECIGIWSWILMKENSGIDLDFLLKMFNSLPILSLETLDI
jgi:hypothetical protein